MSTFERKQDADRHDFTRIQLGLRDFPHLQHGIIDSTKDLNVGLSLGLLKTVINGSNH